MSKTRVTIGMPVFNDILFIEESIKSILNQTFEDFNLIISDDGATDGSSDICLKYADLDKRIEYIRQPINLGISKNMQFLAKKAETEYFMWAGDDDLWDENFLNECIELLDSDPSTVIAFTKYDSITETDEKIESVSHPEYSQDLTYDRLKNFIRNADDGFGYGVLKTSVAKEVSFPTWWWINKKTPYNNIYPTLCFYLAKGNYKEYTDKSLFFKRVKTEGRVNHKLIGKGNAFYETFAYIVRRFNLVVFSSREIRRANNWITALKIYPMLFYRWFLVSSWRQISLAAKSFFKNRIGRK